jgi:hypothetical protein
VSPTKKRAKTKELTQDRLKYLFNYNPDTGDFTRSVNQGTRGRVGDVAGYIGYNKTGKVYLRTKVDGKSYLVHRLAWLYSYGEWPKNHIDHIDQNSLNNRLSNLRDVTTLENNKNQKIYSNNSSGTMGVYFHVAKQKWHAQIRVKGKRLNLGYFKLKEDAISARKEAQIKYGYHPNHGNT